MKRRTLLLHGFGAALGLTAFPMPAHGQARPQVVGFLRSTGVDGYGDIVDAFRKGVAEGGFVEERDFVIDYR